MKRGKTSAALAGGILAAVLMLAGCGGSDEGPAEKAGKQLDKAAGEAAQSMQNAAEAVGDKAEEAGDKLENKTD